MRAAHGRQKVFAIEKKKCTAQTKLHTYGLQPQLLQKQLICKDAAIEQTFRMGEKNTQRENVYYLPYLLCG